MPFWGSHAGTRNSASRGSAGPLSLRTIARVFVALSSRAWARSTRLSAALRSSPAPLLSVPFLADDVHDLGTLAEIESHLF